MLFHVTGENKENCRNDEVKNSKTSSPGLNIRNIVSSPFMPYYVQIMRV